MPVVATAVVLVQQYRTELEEVNSATLPPLVKSRLGVCPFSCSICVSPCRNTLQAPAHPRRNCSLCTAVRCTDPLKPHTLAGG